ncbi:MAG: response regulator [Caulobacteraceae bacterium]|nr:response regulator [Caulobacteraceae bacterium]
MPGISRLIEYPDPIDPASRCGAVLDRFLDHPEWDLMAVVEAGRPRGVVARGAVGAQDAERRVGEVMTAPLTIGPDAGVDEACALLLAHAEPAAGLVVVEGARYLGVVPARALLRLKADGGLAAEDNRRFAELVGRELHAPLSGVLAMAELLQRQPLSVDSQAFVRTIIETCQSMAQTLDGALELSLADTGELALDPQPALLRTVMDEIQSRWQHRTTQQRVTLAVAYDGEPELTAEIDAGRLEQVFDGLIGAALSLARRGAIEASLQAQRIGGELRLTGRVRDTGGGLSAARLSQAFEGQGVAGASHGGLGLALCRRIVERMGGELRAEDNVGAGATIVFEFPAAEAITEMEQADRDTVAVKRAAHVLVVDDNATNRMVAEALCEMFDCTSECVEDGLEALEAARTGRFDLILMDIRMPRMDGVEATRAIRALPGPAGVVPIIALTANADPEDAKSYVACGMHSVVEKPIKPERLLQAMNAALPDVAGRAAAA